LIVKILKHLKSGCQTLFSEKEIPTYAAKSAGGRKMHIPPRGYGHSLLGEKPSNLPFL
jgi:hypothetical protein